MTANAAAPLPRGPRGPYANLICANCRTRKIKCHLPEGCVVSVAGRAQPRDLSCKRCHDLDLDCHVQTTVLGRPAAKRKRTRREQHRDPQMRVALESLALDEDPEDESLEVESHFLSNLEDDETGAAVPASAGPDAEDMFDAMMSPSALIACILARDQRFGAKLAQSYSLEAMPLEKLVTAGMAALLGESLLWHRFHVPLLPDLLELRQALVTSRSCRKSSASQLLFALLCLTALDHASNRLRDDSFLRLHLMHAVERYGQIFLFELPPHRHTLATLLLLYEYKPTALIRSQTTASAALKSNLYFNLAYQTAARLDLGASRNSLLDHMSLRDSIDEEKCEALMHDVLCWAQLSYYKLLVDGLMAVPTADLRQVASELEFSAQAVRDALEVHPGSLSIVNQLFRTYSASLVLKHSVTCRKCCRYLIALANTIEEHENDSKHLENNLAAVIDSLASTTLPEELKTLQGMLSQQFRQDLVKVSGIAIFFAVMHSSDMITTSPEQGPLVPERAIQVNNAIIKNLKHLSYDEPAFVLTSFLSKYGAARDRQLEQLLQSFVTACDTYTLGSSGGESVLYTPPARSIAMVTVFHSRVLVENSAGMKKGWQALHPNVNEHMAVFERCAESLERIIAASLREAYGSGCVFAACAHLLRSLKRILQRWKAELDAAASSTTASASTTSTIIDPASASAVSASTTSAFSEHVLTSPSEFFVTDNEASGNDEALEDLFDQWFDWPRMELLGTMPYQFDEATVRT